MPEAAVDQTELDLCDLEETLACRRAALEQTDHPDLQEVLRAEIRALRAAISRLEARLPAAE
jgi:hypothetical protein